MRTVDFIFDLASPNAYFCHQVIPGIEQRHDVKFRYIPCLLGGIFKATGNRSPMEAFGDIRNKLKYEHLESQRFMARNRITRFVRNPDFPVNTLMLMRGAVFAEREGQFEMYVEAMMHHMWEAPKKMDDPGVVAAALAESGFDPEKFVAGVSDQSVKDELLANTNAAVERGAFGIPTFFVGDEMWFGKERLHDLETFLVNQ